MKLGLRKPSLKKSLKARTVGKWKRKAKSAFNPFYGKKGVGLLKNPSKSIKNRVYKRTTVGVNPLSASGSSKKKAKSKADAKFDKRLKDILENRPQETEVKKKPIRTSEPMKIDKKAAKRKPEPVKERKPLRWTIVDTIGWLGFAAYYFITGMQKGEGIAMNLFSSPIAAIILWGIVRLLFRFFTGI